MATTSGPRLNTSGLTRDVEILELLGGAEALHDGGLGVMRIAQLIGRDKAAVSRALATLADAGLVERDETSSSYRLGSRLYALAARTTESRMVALARPHLRRIALSTRETTHLCVLRGGNVLTIMSELSPHEFRTTGWEGVTTAAWRTPSGRVLLSDWDRHSLERWYAEHGNDRAIISPNDPFLSTTGFSVLSTPPDDKAVVTDFESLLTEIGRIRQRGYALLDEELEGHVVGASAPIFDLSGRIIAAINVSAPKERMGDRLETLGRYVAGAAAALSEQLGQEG